MIQNTVLEIGEMMITLDDVIWMQNAITKSLELGTTISFFTLKNDGSLLARIDPLIRQQKSE